MSMTMDEFRHLLAQARQGDHQAARRLHDEFQPQLKIYVRIQLRRYAKIGRMRGMISSADVCQSAFRTLNEGLRGGEFSFNGPGGFFELLKTIAYRRIYDYNARGEPTHDPTSTSELEDPQPNADLILVEQQETLEFAATLLADSPRQIFEMRREGKSYEEIAIAIGGTAEACRKQLDRALARIRPRIERRLGEDFPLPERS